MTRWMRAARKQAVRRVGRTASVAASAAVVALGLLATFTAGPASAVVFPNLYRLTVTPDPQADGPDATPTDVAMRALLTRLTGLRDPGADPALAELLSNAETFVSYVGQVDNDRFDVEFYPMQVERALEAAGRPFWGPERPLTLVWIVIDDGTGQRLLLSDSGIATGGIADTAGLVGVAPETVALAQSFREEIDSVADERGLPIRLPLLDLEDIAAVTPGEIWGGFVEPIEAASARYRPDAILIGRIRVNEFGEDAQWILVHQGQRNTFAAPEASEGLHWVADRYIEAYGFVGGARTVRLVVRDVWSFDDYARVLSYLEGLSALETVDLDSHDGGVLSLRASARSDIPVLQQTIGLGRVLRIDADAGSFADNTLFLRLASGSRR